jgi:four helix bundle protein
MGRIIANKSVQDVGRKRPKGPISDGIPRNFGYKDQIKRAGLSISSNIAEGFKRSSYRQFGYFLKIARGSPGEVRSQIYIGIKTGATEKEKGLKWVNECKEVSSMLHSLIESTKRIAEKNI